jgi:hypothetical protein
MDGQIGCGCIVGNPRNGPSPVDCGTGQLTGYATNRALTAEIGIKLSRFFHLQHKDETHDEWALPLLLLFP